MLGWHSGGLRTVSTTTAAAIDAIGNRLASTVGPTTAYLLPDLHGNVVASVSSNSTPSYLTAYRYDPYGQTCGVWSATTGTIAIPWRFGGRILESSGAGTDLYDFGARSYDPSLGAFTSFDSVAGSAMNSLTLNRYLYANANPTTMVDPDGHKAECQSAEDCDDGTTAPAKPKPKGPTCSYQGGSALSCTVTMQSVTGTDETIVVSQTQPGPILSVDQYGQLSGQERIDYLKKMGPYLLYQLESHRGDSSVSYNRNVYDQVSEYLGSVVNRDRTDHDGDMVRLQDQGNYLADGDDWAQQKAKWQGEQVYDDPAWVQRTSDAYTKARDAQGNNDGLGALVGAAFGLAGPIAGCIGLTAVTVVGCPIAIVGGIAIGLGSGWTASQVVDQLNGSMNNVTKLRNTYLFAASFTHLEYSCQSGQCAQFGWDQSQSSRDWYTPTAPADPFRYKP